LQAKQQQNRQKNAKASKKANVAKQKQMHNFQLARHKFVKKNYILYMCSITKANSELQ